ncbi:MAG: PTS sugar transporter subunit IIA [Verrucomicrobiota bacterium]
MKSLLDALQEGRLIELPDNSKSRALEYLATLIEAIPDIGVEGGITENVLAREVAHNTGIGLGWACPHARSRHDGELVCAVGWSPSGINYGAPDNAPVYLMVMYFVPETQKNAYLKEISSLAKAIQQQPALQDLRSLTDLGEVRHALLDAISIALESTAPEAKARMIQLEAKHAAVHEIVEELPADLTHSLTPLTVVAVPGCKPIVLCQDSELVQKLESQEQLAAALGHQGRIEHAGIHVLVRSHADYQPDRVVYDCLAFRIHKGGFGGMV